MGQHNVLRVIDEPQGKKTTFSVDFHMYTLYVCIQKRIKYQPTVCVCVCVRRKCKNIDRRQKLPPLRCTQEMDAAPVLSREAKADLDVNTEQTDLHFFLQTKDKRSRGQECVGTLHIWCLSTPKWNANIYGIEGKILFLTCLLKL